MNTLKTIAAVSVIGLVLSMQMAVADEDMVKDYVKTTSGEVVKTSYGDCWRSDYDKTDEKLQECGYPAPEPVKVEKEVVIAPEATAASVTTTVYEDIAISAALLFDFDSAELTDDAKAVIDERIAKYKGKGELTKNVTVIGHTDSTGPAEYNMKLSKRRAQAVADYLAQNTNITDDQIDVIGMGETDPVASNDTKEGRQANRRVVIHLEGKIKK